MLPIHKKLKLIAIGSVCSIAIVIAVNVLWAKIPGLGKLFHNIDLYFYEFFFTPNLTPPDKFIVIDSHDPTESRSRAEYAALIDQLDEAGAKCIALDILFFKETPDDEALVNSVKRCPQVVLAIDFANEQRSSAFTSDLIERVALPDSLCQNIIPPTSSPGGIALPFFNLFAVAQHFGHINPAYEEAYHFPLVLTFGTKCFASLPVEIARVCSAAKENPFQLAQLTLDRDGQILVNFIALEKFKLNSYLFDETKAIFEKQPGAFRDAVVIIVNSAAETELMTPLGAYPRWAVLASVTIQLLQNQHIKAPIVFFPSILCAFMVFLGLVWLLFIAPRLQRKWQRPYFIFLIGSGLMLFQISLLLHYDQQWLGVIVPLTAFNFSLLIARATYLRMIKPPQYLDLNLAVLERQGQDYVTKILESPLGEEASASFKFFSQEQRYQEISQKLKGLEASHEDMKWIGEKLFRSLFQGDAFSSLKESLDLVKKEGKNLRLKLCIDASELASLPWEFMHSAKLPPGFIALHKQLSLVRYIPLVQPVSKTQFRVPLKVLVVVSSPSELPPLDVKGEKKLIKKALRSLIWGGDIRLRFCEEPTLENIRSELRHEPDVLHYIGHSKFDQEKKEASLAFESEANISGDTHSETFGNLLHEAPVKLVVLNSCSSAASSPTDVFSGIAQNLIKIGIPAVVAMQYPLPDHTALWFSETFYSALITNYSIDSAVAETRRYIMTKTGLGQQDWAMPTLFMRSSDGVIFQ